MYIYIYICRKCGNTCALYNNGRSVRKCGPFAKTIYCGIMYVCMYVYIYIYA